MRKSILFVTTIMAVFLMAATAFSPATSASADLEEVQRVGLVTDYTEGQSITIMDQDGSQFTFELASPLKIVPDGRLDLLGVGAFVTIIAPNNIPDGKQIAVSIVIHPPLQGSFPPANNKPTVIPNETEPPKEITSESPTETVPVKETAETVETVPVKETATPTETPTGVETVTETATPTETLTSTSKLPDDSQATMKLFIEWLASLFRQFLVTGS